jgi:hypothetical protein
MASEFDKFIDPESFSLYKDAAAAVQNLKKYVSELAPEWDGANSKAKEYAKILKSQTSQLDIANAAYRLSENLVQSLEEQFKDRKSVV